MPKTDMNMGVAGTREVVDDTVEWMGSMMQDNLHYLEDERLYLASVECLAALVRARDLLERLRMMPEWRQ